MRTLYLPSPVRHTSTAHSVLDALVQDNVDTSETSHMYTVVNALVAEMERSAALTGLFDLRPWRADVRGAGSAVATYQTAAANQDLSPEHERDELEINDLLYGVPDAWSLRQTRSYPWDGSKGLAIAAVETNDGLVVQAEGEVIPSLYSLWLVKETGETTRIWPDQEGIVINDGRPWIIASSEPRDSGIGPSLQAYVGSRGMESVDIAVTIEGFDILVAAKGHVVMSLGFDAVARVDSGADITTLPFFSQAGALYDLFGSPVEYIIEDGIIEFEALPASGVLHYRGTKAFTIKPSPESTNRLGKNPDSGKRKKTRDVVTKVSFSDILSNLYRMPTGNDVQATLLLDVLCRVPGASTTGYLVVDKQGIVEEVVVGHPISHAMATEFHTVVLGQSGTGTTVSLVEHDAKRVVFRHHEQGLSGIGITWTLDGGLGLINQSSDSLEVWCIEDVRHSQSEGYSLPQPQASAE